MNRAVRAHPIAVVRTLEPFGFVLLLPAIQMLFGGADAAFVPASAELPLAVLLTVWAILRRRAFRLFWNEREIRVVKGVLIRHTVRIPRRNLSALRMERGIADALFGSARVILETEADAARQVVVRCDLRRWDAERLSAELFATSGKSVSVPLKRRIFSALATSSAITGLTVAVPTVRRAGKLFGIALSELLYSQISETAARFNARFPKVWNTVTLILLLGYVVSFAAALLAFVRYRLTVGRITAAKRGFFVRRETRLDGGNIRAICLEQTPFLRAARRCFLRVTAGSFGHRYNLPVDRIARQRERAWQMGFPCVSGVFIRPKRDRVTAHRFYRPAFLWLIGIAAEAFLIRRKMPFLLPVSLFLSVPMGIAALYYGYIGHFNYCRGGISFGEKLCAVGSRGFCFRALYCPKHTVGVLRFTEKPWERRYGTCNLKIGVRARASVYLTVRRIDTAQALENAVRFFSDE